MTATNPAAFQVAFTQTIIRKKPPRRRISSAAWT
jgi:hypothetical protein